LIVPGEPLLSPGSLARAVCYASTSAEHARRVFGSNALLFEFGRQAIAVALRECPAGPVLVPAFICDTLVDGVRAAGRTVVYYRLGPDLSPDIDWIEQNAPSAGGAIVVVHYFGFPSPVADARSLADRRGAFLIEDRAHAFLTTIAGGLPLDADSPCVYTWRKFLPVVHGAALTGISAQAATNRRCGVVQAGRSLASWAVFSAGSRRLLHTLGPTFSDEPDLRRNGTAARLPDRLSTGVLASESGRLQRHGQARRHNFRHLATGLSDLPGVTQALAREPDGSTVPWCYPVRVADRALADDLLGALLSEGIGAWRWPTLPAGLDSGAHPEAAELADTTVCLPVHQGLGDDAIAWMIDTVSGWALSRAATWPDHRIELSG